MNCVLVRGYAYESDVDDPIGRALSRGLHRADEGSSSVNKRARRKMSDAMRFTVEAAKRCADLIHPDDRVRTPVFLACASGVDMVVPFLTAMTKYDETSAD